MSVYSGEITVGVIGAGGMGARHADNLSYRVKGARVGGVTDLDRPRAEKLASKYGAAAFEEEPALIRDGGIDAIVIASPDSTHAGLVTECIRNEKPVLCEKPLATSAEDAREIVDAEAELGKKLVQVGFMRRYDPQHVAVEAAVASGSIGRPVLFKGTHRNLAAAADASSESILFNSAVHDLDSARWLLGKEIEGVHVSGASTGAASDGGALDLQLIQLYLSGGRLASIEVYVNAGYGYEVDAEVVGEAGAVRLAPANAPVLRSQRRAGHSVEYDWLERFPEAYVIEAQRWIEDLHAGDITGPDAWDGYMALVAVEGCVASVLSGSTEPLQAPNRPEIYRQAKEATASERR